ncbi:MAG: hypothetical protein A3J93_02830 [Candidatus Magasanikbacteria bacterium RIFOXYC2_FULL_42_28]|uniref:Isoleucine--tRNA ligase n=1 Tax=Candidatus Magasanikbacteria bacterium RIFOXYC2_FULL_42_28 TaxID=1798704 RepID=A0A1F6NUP2_9BACT|nr:MAG: hypothetical protein A3J93_02830 [Candidatus Magasanikbacteria bacterium RIFOXYC2_FULL_42_28]
MYNSNQHEQEILKYWQDHNCFEKSVSQRPEDKPYVFYDGPPFATGLPHYGHILSSVIKDVVPRYWTMKGYRVRRRWGWDCHGLPIENIIEKEFKVSGRKEIEEKFGVDKFNDACGSKVLMYAKEWKKMVDRIGRWIEFDNAYKTMDSTYMESVWWSLKTMWDKGLIYKGRKMLMYCPRCETPVSKAEIAMDNSYKDITELSLTVRFKLLEEKDTYLLAWTTTPWTLPAHMFIAVGPDIEYVKVKYNNEYYIIGKKLLPNIFKGKDYEMVSDLSAKDLVGKKYEPLFPFYKEVKNGLKVWEYQNVSDEEGTGLVHMAAFGDQEELDFMNKNDIELIVHLNTKGEFVDGNGFLTGKKMKSQDREIRKYLEENGKLFSAFSYTHSYPHCWRCDTQLFYNPTIAWFINIQKIKPRLIELNEKINWFPDHLKHGRFLNILETAPDWNISRNRYWATPLPFWVCGNEECLEKVCIGSVAELKEQATNYAQVYESDKVKEMDLHKHKMDKIKLKCPKCSNEMTRIPEVIDCWVESASMPFAEFHYPFENQDVFEKRFPGQYIAEYIAQTRAWFYYMHVMSVLLFDDISYENVVCTGTILNDRGEKLSKSKMNYTDPWIIIDQYGVDALRYYLLTSVVLQADNLLFNDREVRDIYNKVVNMLWNVVEFYKTYATEPDVDDEETRNRESSNLLDKWILARLSQLVGEVTTNMDNYDTVKAGRPIKDFIDEMSTWYVRRSRDRFKTGDENDKINASNTLRHVLVLLSKLMAPFTPFIAEKIYLELTGGRYQESVHLETWPEIRKVDEEVLGNMATVRKVVELGLSLRAEAGVKVRQVLGRVVWENSRLAPEYLEIVKDELNVKAVVEEKDGAGKWVVKEEGTLKVSLDMEVTPELKKEGLAREIIRAINQMRKETGLTVNDKVDLVYETDDTELADALSQYGEEVKSSVLAASLATGTGETELAVSGRVLRVKMIKI